MPGSDWHHLLQRQLSRLASVHLLRQRRVVTPIDSVHVQLKDRSLVNFASNDYLGLSHHPRVIAAAIAATSRYGVGSGAAPLITGYTDAHASAEEAIARWKGAEAAVLFSSGYQANTGLVQALSAAGQDDGGIDGSHAAVRFLLDKLCHASLIDAIRGLPQNAGESSGTAYRVFPHNGINKLQRLLLQEGTAWRSRNVIVTESIFSMDGDAVDLPAIMNLIDPQDLARPLLVLDEAHGSGVYGQAGAGYASELQLDHRVDATLVTLSKALGCIGAAVCGSRALCDALINFGRAYIFSTSMPASVAAAAEAAIAVLRDEPHRQQRVRALSRHVRQELRALGLMLPQSASQPEDSPIVPILLGDEAAALSAAETLQQQGLFVLAIRPPTVPRGTSRLRITLSSAHSDAEVEMLLAAIRQHRDVLRQQ